DLQREIAVVAVGAADDHGVGVVLEAQVTGELRLAQQVLDAQAQVPGATQVEEPARHAVEPDDLALRIENDHAVGERGRRALELAHEPHEALLVKALAPMQAHDLRDDLPPDAADLRRHGEAAMSYPPFHPEEHDELPCQVDGERAREPGPDPAER